MCLQNRLVVTRPDHVVLRRPLPLGMVPEEVETPAHYLRAKPELGCKCCESSRRARNLPGP